MSKVMKFLMIYPCSLNFKTLSCHNVGIEFFYIRGDLNVGLPSPLELNLYWEVVIIGIRTLVCYTMKCFVHLPLYLKDSCYIGQKYTESVHQGCRQLFYIL